MSDFPNAQTLLGNVQRSLQAHPPAMAALSKLQTYMQRKRWRAVLFGGALRDAMLGDTFASRDFEVVVESEEFGIFEQDFLPLVERRTRFGGLALRIDGVKIDVWPLHGTWAFRTKCVLPASFENLPATSLLSIEAVTLNLDALASGVPVVHEKNFFTSVVTRIVDINLSANPFPALSVVRTIVVAKKFGLRVTRELASFLISRRGLFEPSELESVQKAHYGEVLFPALMIEALLARLDTAVNSSQSQNFPLGSY
jgi:hypothetical protein